jgi:type I pantothenate kinase
VTHSVDGRYLSFDREAWADLRAATPLTLRESELRDLRGINDRIDLDEVAAVYLPLTRLLNLYVAATQNLHKVSAAFLGTLAPKVPYVIGVAGSVAVGKSTFARILQALLARWPDHPQVDLVTTDGFLHPNAVLAERGIMNKKGFPESYDTRRLIEFLREVKSGARQVSAPVYSHVVYDIVPGDEIVVRQPDILILEGLNVLQVGGSNEFVSDYFDFSIYVDAAEAAHRGVLRAALPHAVRHRLPGPRQLLPALRAPQPRDEAVADRTRHLARDQRQEPAARTSSPPSSRAGSAAAQDPPTTASPASKLRRL